MTSAFKDLLRNPWLAMFSIKFFLLLLVFNITFSTADDTVKIAAILDTNTLEGREANLSLHLALRHVNDATNLTINGTRLNLHLQQYDGNVGSVLQVFREEVVAIVVQDPKISKFLASIAEAVQVPILSLSGESGIYGSAGRSRYVVSVVPNHSQSDEMQVITAMVEYLQWKQIIVIYEEEEYWLSGVYALNEALEQQQKTRISQSAGVSSFSDRDDIKNTLLQLNKSHFRAYILYTSVDVGLKIFSLATELGMMKEPYAWVVTDSIASSIDSINDSSIKTMQGIVGIRRLIPLTPQIMDFQKRLQLSSSEMGSKGIWLQVYNCISLISKAVVDLVSNDVGGLQFKDFESPETNTDFVASVKVFRGGELLLEQINNLKSDGLTYYNGENLQYEIINLAGRSYRTVGFWTREKGLKSPTGEPNKISSIIWPGDTANIPNGYRKLVFGRVRGRSYNFTQFMGRFSGYINDTFEAAVNLLPYNLPFVYEAFDKGNSNLSNYDALVTELVNGKKFDAVVGDATILWNRSLYVEFSQPYTSTGLVMMVPQRKLRNRTWSFLYPFTTGLWAIAGAYFVFTAFLVWLMEPHDSEDFKGGIIQQTITSLTLSLSAFVFAQREDVKSGLGKVVVATWLFTALVLNNSYTAHLTSILTVQKLSPALTSMANLTTSNIKVGYMNGSFVKQYLMKDLNISEKRLVPLRSAIDYVENLTSEKVGAIVDEAPYINTVRSMYPCANFTIVDQGYFNTGGFGFFFKKGSPFLEDISQAVLNVSEQHNTVQGIRSKWFGQGNTCPQAEATLDSPNNPISPKNLWILLVLTISIYAITVVIYFARKLTAR